MNKGFTLIELLIVMVLVGVLVTVALPKYYSSMERGRVLEAVNNLRAASDAINAAYVMNDNEYPLQAALEENGHVRGDFAKAVSFTVPTIAQRAHSFVILSSKRIGGDEYTLQAYSSLGDLEYISCIPKTASDGKLCETLGFEKDGSTYKMDFTK